MRMFERERSAEIVQSASMPIEVGPSDINPQIAHITESQSRLRRSILTGGALFAGIAIALDCGERELHAENFVSNGIDKDETVLSVDSSPYRLIVLALASDGMSVHESKHTVVVPNVSSDGTPTPTAVVTSEAEAEYTVVAPLVSKDGEVTPELTTTATETVEAQLSDVAPNVEEDDSVQVGAEESHSDELDQSREEPDEEESVALSASPTPAPASHTVIAPGLAKDNESPESTFTVIVPGVSKDVTPTPAPFRIVVGGVTKDVNHEFPSHQSE